MIPGYESFSKFAADIAIQKYALKDDDGNLLEHSWAQTAHRVPTHVFSVVPVNYSFILRVAKKIRERKIMPGGRYLYASGRPFHQVQNCVLFRAEDSREGWADVCHRVAMALMTGAGVGVEYSDVRAEGKPIKKTGGTATGPLALMQMVNEIGRGVRQGGSRRSAIWAGLNWNHPDIHKFITMKNWSDMVKAMKESNFDFPATMDGTNISVGLDDDFFHAYHIEDHPLHAFAQTVYWKTVRQMLETGEPGFSINVGDWRRENLRNACTEVTSFTDSDVCNLASINMARIDSEEEMEECVELVTALTLAGTVYSDVPTDEIRRVRDANRRLGIGLMGLHEFLMKRGLRYGPSDELARYLEIYTKTDVYSKIWADRFGINSPIKTRAIAPTGTIGIVAETTTGIEPIFAAAFKRRYMKGNTWNYQYVLDPTAKKFVDAGMDPDLIEDAYSISPERRVSFQAWVQEYVDHGISSTINLPQWGSEENNESTVQEFGKMLIKYLPKLRGITCYPDGSRGGQPLTTVKYKTAAKHVGEVFVEAQDICDYTKGGTCGS